ncbi:MAG: ATP-binding protein [Gammaproteobacteria bacterium]|nr:ATP-binding protein [Gammaproteobacteria bacterium]
MSETLARNQPRQAIEKALGRSQIVALLGPRQCGKTTLARSFSVPPGNYLDLERTADRSALAASAESTLGALTGLVVIDEIQELPQLFPTLRVLADREPLRARFLILGSVSPELIRGASETLAGRVEFVPLGGFTLEEVSTRRAELLWQRGGFPRSFLAADDADSFAWRSHFIDTFLTRDAARLGIALAPEALRCFWIMLAHLHGGLANAAELARTVAVTQATASKYIDVLTHAFLLRRLSPWHANVRKRLVKSPKLYLRDSGILHALLGLRDPGEVLAHPRMGWSWEGFALEQVLAAAGPGEAWFYATHGGAELDLLLQRGGRRHGFEFRFTDAPATHKSMHIARADLDLAKLWVVYRGERAFALAPGIEALPLQSVPEAVRSL